MAQNLSQDRVVIERSSSDLITGGLQPQSQPRFEANVSQLNEQIISDLEALQADFFIDDAVEGLNYATPSVNGQTLQLYSHGRPGELYLEGSWRSATEITKWLEKDQRLAGKAQLNIYGCEFGKGAKGGAAVAYLESSLGLAVAASDDLTGIDGDWELEVGTPSVETFGFPAYPHNLQGFIDCSTTINSTTNSINNGFTPFKVKDGFTYVAFPYFTRNNVPEGLPVVNGNPAIANGNSEVYVAIFDPNCEQIFGTFYGGVSGDDDIRHMDIDADGNFVILGFTDSPDFPTTDGTTVAGGDDQFILKFAPDGTLLFATVYGGTDDDNQTRSLTLDGTDIYTFGQTASPDFPTTDGTTPSGADDVFVTKYDASGNLLFATLLGGSARDFTIDIAVHNGGLILFGSTESPDFPTTDGTTVPGGFEAFLTHIDAAGNTVFSTIIAGNANDEWAEMIFDGTHIYLRGRTRSTDLLTTDGSTNSGEFDIVLRKYDLAGNLVYGTLIGSSRSDRSFDLEVVNGNAYVLGVSEGADYPVVGGIGYTGADDIVLTKFDGNGNIVFSTYYGSSRDDFAANLLVTPSEEVYVIVEANGSPLTTDGSSGSGLAYVKFNTDGTLCAATVLPFAPEILFDSKSCMELSGDTLTTAFLTDQGSGYTTDATLSAGTRNNLTVTRFVFCPAPTAVASDVLSPASQMVCQNGLVEQILGEELFIDGSTFPPIYRQGVVGDQPDLEYFYQWESAPSATGPWTAVAGPLALQQNYSPPPTSVDVFYRRVTSTSECCGSMVVSTSNAVSVLVTADEAPAVALSELTITCPGDALDLVATVTGGTPNYDYSWSDGTMNNTALTMDMISVAPAAVSLFGVTVTDANGCVQASQAPVQVYQADAGPDLSVCAGTPITIGGAPFPGLTIVPEGSPVAGEYSIAYTWSPATGLNCTDCPNPVTSSAVDEMYMLEVTLYRPDGTSCMTTSSMDVSIVAAPAADFAGIDMIICNGETASLGAPPELTTYNVASGTATTGATGFGTAGGAVNAASLMDGDFTTGVKTNDGTAQSVIFDLGNLQLINMIEIATYDGTASGNGSQFDTDFTIEVSSDNVNWTRIFRDVRTSSSAVTRISASEITALSFPQQDVRYFRFVPESNTRDVGISEFSAIYGYTYVWAPGEFLATNGSTATFDAGFVLDNEELLLDPNPYTYTVSAELNGCVFIDEVQVTMIEARAGEDFCGPRTLGMPDRTPNVAETYSWVRLDGASTATTLSEFLGTTDIPEPPVSASVGGETHFELTVTHTLANGQMATCTDIVIVPTCGPCDIDFAKENGCSDFDIYGASEVTAFIDPGTGLDSDDFTVTWSPMEGLDTYTERTVTVLDNVDRTYTVTFVSTVDPAFTCMETVRVNNPANSLPVFNVTPSVDVCANDPVNIGDPNMNPLLVYRWNPLEGLDDAGLSFPEATVVETTVFTGTVTDPATGCKVTEDVTVNINGAADAGPDRYVCDNGVVTLGTPALPNYSYSWMPDVANTPPNTYRNGTSDTDAEIEVFVAADQQFILTTTDLIGGCVAVDIVDVFVSPLPAPFTLADDVFCPSEPGPYVLGFDNIDGTGANNVPALTGAETYSWSPAFYLNDPTVQNPTLTTVPSTEVAFTLTISSGPGCNAMSTQTITPVFEMPLTVISPLTICLGEEVAVGSDDNPTGPGDSYFWEVSPANPAGGMLSDINSPNPIFSSTVTGEFFFRANRIVGGCFINAIVSVTVEELALDPVVPINICMGESVQIGPDPIVGLSYEYFPTTGLSDPFIANPIFTGTMSQTYTLTVVNGRGCIDELIVAVNVSTDPAPMITLTDETICEDEELDFTIMPTVTPAGTYSYAWSPPTNLSDPSILNPMVSLPSIPGDYPLTLVVTDQTNGCRAEETVTYSYLSDDCVFDLALTKVLATGQMNRVMSGDDVVFTITIVNQGTINATAIAITDYLPTNTTYTATGSTASGVLTTAAATTANLVNNGDGTFSIDALAAGDMVSFDIALTVDGAAPFGTLTNTAEITDAMGGLDEDSPLSEVSGESDDVSELLTDDDIDDDSTGGTDNPADEDDYDLAQFVVSNDDPVAVGDTVWVDLNNDGLLTAGEPGIDNVTVTIYDNATGMPVTLDFDGMPYTSTQMTGPDGGYFFDNLPPGDYYVIFDLSTGDNAEFYDFTNQNVGANDGLDSDADPMTGQSDPTGQLASGEEDRTLDAGVVCITAVTVAPPATICNSQPIDLTTGASVTPTTLVATWNSPDGNGTFDGGMDFATATTYTPSPEDVSRGTVTLTLTTADPAGPCGAEFASVTFVILNVDCGAFFWDGDKD